MLEVGRVGLADLVTQTPAPPEVTLMVGHMAQDPHHKSHCWGKLSHVPKRHFHHAGHSKDIEVTSQELVIEQSFLSECQVVLYHEDSVCGTPVRPVSMTPTRCPT